MEKVTATKWSFMVYPLAFLAPIAALLAASGVAAGDLRMAGVRRAIELRAAARVVQSPADEGELQRDARFEDPARDLGKAAGLAQHEDVDVEIAGEHESDGEGGGAAGLRGEEAEAAEDLGSAGEQHPVAGVGVVVGHDVAVEILVPEVIDAGSDVKEGLREETEAGGWHVVWMLAAGRHE